MLNRILVFFAGVLSLGWAVGATADTYRETVLFSFDQSWKVWDTGEAPPENWAAWEFTPTAWQDSPGPFARLDNPDGLRAVPPALSLRVGGDTVYARTTFRVADDYRSGDARLLMDVWTKDGAVFYLNGVEVGRSPTLAAGEVTHQTRAFRSPRLRRKAGFWIDPALLRPGHNVFAVSLHSHIDEENPDERALAAELVLVEGLSVRPARVTPHHLRVVWVENPQHEAMVSWTVEGAPRDHVLHLDTVPRVGGNEPYAQHAPATHTGEITLARADIRLGIKPAHFVHVHLRDLMPDTVYYLRAETDGRLSEEVHFRTAPAEDRPVKLLFGGDSRIGGSIPYLHHDRRGINRRMASLTELHPDIIGFVHGGDFTQLAQWRFLGPWLTDHELARTQEGRIIPLVPIRGNHDRDIGWEEIFWWPGQQGRYYFETAVTPRIRVVVLNTEISLGGQQRAWLRDTLATARPESRWLLAAYHRPAWPSVRGFEDGANRRQFWVPHFEEHRIDLALESHDHALKRTVPILDSARHEEGIVYIGDGGLGVPQRQPDSTRWYFQSEIPHDAVTASVHHVHILDFTTDALIGTAYGLGGEILDRFSRPHRTGVAWGLPAEPAEAPVAAE